MGGALSEGTRPHSVGPNRRAVLLRRRILVSRRPDRGSDWPPGARGGGGDSKVSVRTSEGNPRHGWRALSPKRDRPFQVPRASG